MQNRAVRLMASKLAVAGIIEGNFTDEGLAAMSDCADMTTALARELTQGIKDEVEDLSAVFKKMAILKPVVLQIPPEAVREDAVIGDTVAEDITEDTVIESGTVDDAVARHNTDGDVATDAAGDKIARKDVPVYQAYMKIMDDTSEMTVYSTNAPVPISGLLSFVNHTRRGRAVRGRTAEIIEMDNLLDSIYEESEAA